MSGTTLGLVLVVAGAVVALVGVLVMTGALSWFGRLPGDVRVETDNVRVFIPITSMLLVSALLSLLFTLLRRML